MVLSVKLNPRFNKLNANSLRNKADFRTRERRAIVDITFPTSQLYVTGGLLIDLSKIRNFIEVYAGNVIIKPLKTAANLEFQVIPAADNKASGVKIALILDGSGNEEAAMTNLGSTFTITAEIIGI